MLLLRLAYPIIVATLVVVVIGCEVDTPPVSVAEEVGGERVHPDIAFHSPDPGSFVDDGEVTIEGGITVGSAPIEEVSVNGEPIEWEGEHFETTVALNPGPNIFGLRVEAEDRGRAVDSMTIYGPSVQAPDTTIEHMLQVHLGQEVIDNDTVKLDDIAGVVEALLEDEEFLEWLFSEPFEAGNLGTLKVTRIDTSAASVDLLATPGCLEGTIVLGEVEPGMGGYVEADLEADGFVSILGDEVLMSADRIYVETDICTVNEEGTELEARDTFVAIDGLRLSTNERPDLSEQYPDAVETLSETAEEGLEAWIAESMADLVNDFLEGFVSSYSFGEDPEVTASLGIRDLVIDDRGVGLDLFGQFSAPHGLFFDPLESGSVNADVPPLVDGFSEEPMAVAMSMNGLNQLLFAMWYGGGFQEEVDPELEALGELPEVFQPISALEYRLWLPPALIAPTYAEDFIFDFVVGGIDVELLAGQDRDFDLGAEIQAGVGIDVDAQGRLDLQLDNRPQFITVQASVGTAPQGLERGDIAALLRMMIPSILGELDVTFRGFAIPSLAISELGDSLSGFEGREITFVPANIDASGPQRRYLLVEGSVQEVVSQESVD